MDDRRDRPIRTPRTGLSAALALLLLAAMPLGAQESFGIEDVLSPAFPYELIVYPDEVHDFLIFSRWVQAFEATEDFLDRRLRDGAGVAASVERGIGRR